MSKWNIASFSKEELDKTPVDKAAADVALQKRINKPVVPELVEREQPEHLRQYFREQIELAFLTLAWYCVVQYRKKSTSARDVPGWHHAG